MIIKLINPERSWDECVSSARTFKIKQLNLTLLAAYTPPEHTVKIVDESFAPDNIDEEIDLVGITVMTDTALRAYQLADTYRDRGVIVVMGGVHATVLPNEVLKHADAVVIGEGDEVWPTVISDAADKKLQRIYISEKKVSMKGLPIPRHDLYPQLSFKSYTPLATAVATSRGCPYHCEFCSVCMTMGHQYRMRPVNDVIKEIDSLDLPYIVFVDDNLAFNRAEAKTLFRQMIPLKRHWVGEGTVSLAEDIELLKLIKASGCEGLQIGFESVQKNVQKELLKISKLSVTFSEAMHRFHEEGIFIMGAFFFGSDHEESGVFDQTIEFAIKQKLDLIQLRLINPYPGTRLYQRLLKEGRLVEPEWWLKGCGPDTLVFRPLGINPDQLIEGLETARKSLYSLKSISKRFFGIHPWKRSILGWIIYFGTNLAHRKMLYGVNLKNKILDRQ